MSKTVAESRWSLALDVVVARILVWVARRGRNVELTPEAHMYFFDRYQRLAALHRAHGRVRQAKRLQAIADAHYRPGPHDGPPYAAAMAMARPTRLIHVRAVSRARLNGPDDAA